MSFSYRSDIGELVYAIITYLPDIRFTTFKLSHYKNYLQAVIAEARSSLLGHLPIFSPFFFWITRFMPFTIPGMNFSPPGYQEHTSTTWRLNCSKA